MSVDILDDVYTFLICLKDSPTNVIQSFGKQPKAAGTVLDGLTTVEAVEAVMM